MAMRNPKGRVNYEPNSWGGAAGGPREAPDRGYQSFAAEESGQKRRVRSELFADHFSQARQFYLSQTEVERTHIKDAFVFELSKVDTVPIRTRMVANLMNVDESLARLVADGLGLSEMPKASQAARPVVMDLPTSPALSILGNAKNTFKGRKLGILTADGADADILNALTKAAEAEGAMVELIAPKVGGITDSKGKQHPVQQKVNGGPSVLYDAVAIVISDEGARLLSKEATARDFVADAYAHAKFIGYVPNAEPLLRKAGVMEQDEGMVALKSAADAKGLLTQCRKLRFWLREMDVHAV
jgi:catalase